MVDRFKADPRPAEELIETFHAAAPRLRRWLQSRLPDEQDARDGVQEVFLRLCQSASKPDDPMKYLFAIARNVACDMLDRCRREPVKFDSNLVDHYAEYPAGQLTDGVSDSVGVQQALIRALEGLRPIEREIVELIKGEGMSYEEVGRALKLSKRTVKKYAAQAMAQLRMEWIGHQHTSDTPSRSLLVEEHDSATAAVEDAYRDRVIALHGTMHGYPPGGVPFGVELPLEDVVVNAHVRPIASDEVGSKSTVGTNVLPPSHRSMIIGTPGSGKTVFLKRLAVLGAQGRLKRNDRSMLPVFVPLSSITANDAVATGSDLARQAARLAASQGDVRFESLVHKAFRAGRALLLLDGLDELHQEDLPGALSSVRRFCGQYPRVPVVLTTRPVAHYPERPEFSQYEILPLDDGQIREFVHRWSAVLNAGLELSTKASLEADKLLGAISSSAGLKQLARSPFLLTLLIFFHRQGYRLPARRVEFYEFIVAKMLSAWEHARSISRTPPPPRVDPAAVQMSLSALAFGMTVRGERVVRAEMASAIAGLPDGDSSLMQLLQDVATHSALLKSSREGQFEFSHVSFQEFFAARAIIDMPEEQAQALIKRHYFQPRFAEVARLALSWIDARETCGDFVARTAEELLVAAAD